MVSKVANMNAITKQGGKVFLKIPSQLVCNQIMNYRFLNNQSISDLLTNVETQLFTVSAYASWSAPPYPAFAMYEIQVSTSGVSVFFK